MCRNSTTVAEHLILYFAEIIAADTEYVSVVNLCIPQNFHSSKISSHSIPTTLNSLKTTAHWCEHNDCMCFSNFRYGCFILCICIPIRFSLNLLCSMLYVPVSMETKTKLINGNERMTVFKFHVIFLQ